jgi:Rod binding domain-containing protein
VILKSNPEVQTGGAVMLSAAAATVSTAATAATASAATAASTAAASPPPRLVHAAHEFEAQMMQELLKPLTSGAGLGGEDGDSDSGSNNALGEYASEALGRALSEHGGFGIATSIIRELSAKGNQTVTGQVTGKVTGNLHGNTVISPRQ